MRKLALAGAALVLTSAVSAQAHQCYRRVVEPPRYSTVEEQVMVAPDPAPVMLAAAKISVLAL